ncbi:MAG: HYR domain-containing protein [Flavobacteriales bacterium]|nr:HYR domain-containing protein [Flavobacteriales bacterium]
MTLDASGNATITSAQLDGGSTDNGTIVSIVASQTSFDCSDVGNVSVTLTVTDDGGNVSTCDATVTVVDNINPSITCPTNVSVNTNSGCTATGVALGTPITADNCTDVSVTNNAPVAFPIGTTVVTWTVTDNSGNTATCLQNVTVADASAPVIAACSSNISLNAGAACTAVATWSAPTVSDNCSGATITRTAGPASGTAFTIGTTTITYTATDGAGKYRHLLLHGDRGGCDRACRGRVPKQHQPQYRCCLHGSGYLVRSHRNGQLLRCHDQPNGRSCFRKRLPLGC